MDERKEVLEYDATSMRGAKASSVNWKRVGLIALILCIATAIYFPFSPAGRQAANMRKGEAFLPPVRQALAADPRFSNVQIHVYTANLGSFIVKGVVASQADKTALQTFIAGYNLPLPVTYAIGVDPATATATAPLPSSRASE